MAPIGAGSAALILAVPLLMAAGALGGLMWASFKTPAVLQRLNHLLGELDAGSAAPATAPSHLKALLWLIEAPGRVLKDAASARLERRLSAAGRPGGMTAGSFFGLQILVGSITGAAGLVLFGFVAGVADFRLPLLGAVSALIGYRLPLLWLARRTESRRARIRSSLPDALDLITVSVEAGLTFEAALAKFAERATGPLAEEFGRVLREVGFGKGRVQALKDMAARIDSAEMRSFVAAIVQAADLGGDIGNVLRAQAGSARMQRRQRAQKRALEAPVKIVFPLVFLILPSTFVVILGPAVLQLLPVMVGK